MYSATDGMPGGEPPLSPRVVTINAPHGSGKTAYLDALAATARGRVVRVAVQPGWGHDELARHLRADEFLDAEGRKPRLILVDDAQHVADPKSVALLTGLALRTPTDTRLVIAGCGLPPLPWGRLDLDGRLLELDQSHLFDAGDLPTDLHELRRPPPREGWGGLSTLDSPGSSPFGSETLAMALDELTADERTALRHLAVLGSADVALWRAASTPTERGGIERFLRRPFPLVQVGPSPHRVLRVHDPLRQLLLDEVRETQPERGEEVATWGVRTLLQRDADEHAFDLLRRWGDRRALIRLVYTQGAQRALTGRPQAVVGWLAHFTDEERATEPGLLFVGAIGRAAEGDFSALDEWLARTALDQDTPVPVVPALTPLRVAAGGEIARRTLVSHDPGQQAWRVLGAAVAAFEAAASGQFDEAELRLTTMRASAAPYVVIEAWRALSLNYIYRSTGRGRQGADLVEAAAHRAEAEGVADMLWLAGLDAARARHAAASDDHPLAKRLIGTALDKLARYAAGLAGVRLHHYLELAHAARTIGDVTLARELLAEAEHLQGQVPRLARLAADLQELRRVVPPLEGAQPRLTPAQLRTLRALAGHATLPEIAESLQVAPSTIRAHVRALHRALGTHTRAETVDAARERGFL